MKLATAFVEIRVDRQRAEKEAKDAATGAYDGIKKIFSQALVIGGLKASIDAASNLQQSIGATAAVFGTATGAVDDFAKSSAASFGISARAARELTSQLGALLQGFGFTASEAASTSVEITKLGADLSAAFGGKPEDAVQALGSALRGEFDPLERYGVSLNATRIAAKAVELGLAESTSTVDANAKATAALALIQESSAGIAGQFGREIETAAGQQAVAAAEAEEAAASFGEVLLPVYSKALEIVTFLVDKFAALPAPLQTAIVGLAGVAAFSGPLGTVKDVVVDLAESLGKVGVSASTAYATLGALGGVLALAGGLYYSYSQDKARAKQVTDDFVGALNAEAQGQKDALKALIARQIVDSKYLGVAEKLGLTTAQIADVITGKSVPAFDKARVAIEDVTDGTEGWDLKNFELQRTLGITSGEATNFLSEIDKLSTGYSSAVVETAKLDAANKALGVGVEETATATTDLADAAAELAKRNDDTADAMRDAAKAADAQRQAIADLYDEMISQVDAQRAYERAIDDSDEAIGTYLTTLADQQSTQEDVTDAARTTADQLIDTAKAYAELEAGSTSSKAGIDAMIESLFTQALKLSPGDPLRQNLLDYIGELQKIPTSVDTTIRLKVTGQTVTKDGDIIGVRALPGGVVQSARGRYVPAGRNLLTTVAEPGAGPEAILPLQNRNRLVELLGDPRIGGPVADALTESGGNSTTVATSSSTFTLVNNRRDLTVDDVSKLIRMARLN
jgi:tetratricopeptide (TPR) repeat protein